ncbi:MAG: Fe-S cluster assembly sulfur transfer protein SufU [Minisyncoccota bacterium]
MDIYQDRIMDHYRNPRNHGRITQATHRSEARNPTCGDTLQMDIIVKNAIIEDVRFSGTGCAISQASADLLMEYIKKKSVTKALALTPKDMLDILGVTLSPARLKCGLLSLETLQKTVQTKASIIQ